jgi:thioredoxin reductase
MKKITVIGAGVAGMKLIEEIRAQGLECRVRLIDQNKFFISRKDMIKTPLDISGRIEIAEWAKEKQVDFIQSKVERVSPKRNKIYCKTGETFEFKTLIAATGLRSKKILLKGDHREGFFYFSDMDNFSLCQAAKISRESAVYVSDWLGIRFAVSLIEMNLEVLLISSSLDFLGPRKKNVLNYLKSKNISVHQGYSIEEVVGEASVKAVKLIPLKVFSSQLVCVDSGFTPNLDLFDEEVIPRDTFFSNFENIHLLGDVNEKNIENEDLFIYNHHNALKQAEIFALFLSGKSEAVFIKKEAGELDIDKCYHEFNQEPVGGETLNK